MTPVSNDKSLLNQFIQNLQEKVIGKEISKLNPMERAMIVIALAALAVMATALVVMTRMLVRSRIRPGVPNTPSTPATPSTPFTPITPYTVERSPAKPNPPSPQNGTIGLLDKPSNRPSPVVEKETIKPQKPEETTLKWGRLVVEVIEGEFHQDGDKITGTGKVRFRNTFPQLIDGKLHWLVLDSSRWDSFVGTLNRGIPVGTGKFINENGEYEGEFLGEIFIMHGTGKFTNANGDVYDGHFENGSLIEGTYTHGNEVAIGKFENSRLKGQGIITSPNKTIDGFFINGHLHGEGKITTKYSEDDNDIEEEQGRFEEGFLVEGTRKWGDESYVGKFKDGQFLSGKYYYRGVLKAEGEFNGFNLEGIGKKFYSDGSISHEGTFHNDNLVEGTVTYLDGRKYRIAKGKVIGGTKQQADGSVTVLEPNEIEMANSGVAEENVNADQSSKRRSLPTRSRSSHPYSIPETPKQNIERRVPYTV